MSEKQFPYLLETVTRLKWNPEYPEDNECECGHVYYRHFDTYDDMRPVGCKYCPCATFREPPL